MHYEFVYKSKTFMVGITATLRKYVCRDSFQNCSSKILFIPLFLSTICRSSCHGSCITCAKIFYLLNPFPKMMHLDYSNQRSEGVNVRYNTSYTYHPSDIVTQSKYYFFHSTEVNHLYQKLNPFQEQI